MCEAHSFGPFSDASCEHGLLIRKKCIELSLGDLGAGSDLQRAGASLPKLLERRKGGLEDADALGICRNLFRFSFHQKLLAFGTI
jgi:hypothetical protein